MEQLQHGLHAVDVPALVVITAADRTVSLWCSSANKYPELCVTLIHLYMHLFPNYCWQLTAEMFSTLKR